MADTAGMADIAKAQASQEVVVVGAGLAGSECAFQLAERGVRVRLVEQKPHQRMPAQQSEHFAELVCSNSFRGAALHNAVGLLKEEMRRAGSLVMAVGQETQVPAGGAFAVDRAKFSAEITRRMHRHPNITVVAEEVLTIPDVPWVVLATGPLTGDALAEDIARVVGKKHLAYYDAIAPVIQADSINWDVAFKASRYDKGGPEGDKAYVNCPLDEAEYSLFVDAILSADKVTPKAFEKVRYFEGCLPIEVHAERGFRTLAFGCMKPVGLTDPRTGRWPYAVVQLRQENNPPTAYNMVGFQTRMTWPEQKRVFRMIPGLENATFERFGTVHRNTFVDAPEALTDEFALQAQPSVFLAGQISGVEGYVESAACGLLIGKMLADKVQAKSCRPWVMPPPETAFGALLGHLRKPNADFQPSNIIWSMFPALGDAEEQAALAALKPDGTQPQPQLKKKKKKRLGKRERRDQQVVRALAAVDTWLKGE